MKQEVRMMQKIAVVYYSMSGNTDYAARMIAEKTGAALIRLVPEKAYPDTGFRKFFWGGKSAVMGETPALEPYQFDADAYDLIVLGTPVWASSFSPPVRSFVKENKDATDGKRMAAFVCCSGGGAEKALEKLRKFTGVSSFDAEMVLIDPKEKPSDDIIMKVEQFCKKIAQNENKEE